jgi:RNA polymerase sigma factor (sigma-70 family)
MPAQGQLGTDNNPMLAASAPRVWRGGLPEGGQGPFHLPAESTGDLVRKASKGDERAWAQLIARFRPMILGIAARTGLSPADAADVQQNTWIQLMRRADQIRDPDRIAAWLATTARRQSQCIAIASSKYALCDDPLRDREDLVASAGDEVESTVMRSGYEATLELALESLPPVYRRILELLCSDAAPTYAEVAASMALPVGSIGPMRLRALQILRRSRHLREGRWASNRP